MVIKYKEVILKPAQMGIALEDITEGSIGRALFEIVPGSGEYEEFEVKAIEYVRKNHEVWVVDTENGITEHTPQELKYDDILGIPHRVTERYQLPVTELHTYDDYKEIDFTDTEVSYTIGTAAHEANSELPESFVAKSILMRSTEDCYVRFNDKNNVQHKLKADTWYSFNIRTEKIYVVRVTTNGTLTIHAEG